MHDAEMRLLAEKLVCTVLRAGKVTLRYFRTDAARATWKADGSPVTLADQEAEDLILRELREIAPDIPVIAEEAVSRGNVPAVGQRFFLVDPLDGTSEFTGGSGEFTINIGLVEGGAPVFGIVYAPALGDLYVTVANGQAAMASVSAATASGDTEFGSLSFNSIATRPPSQDGLCVVASLRHGSPDTSAWLERLPLPVVKRRNIGSSLKFCLIARGEADVYPRHGPTMEWDTAAGHAVLQAAGGIVTDLEGEPLLYGKVNVGLRNRGFIAYSSEELRRRLAAA